VFSVSENNKASQSIAQRATSRLSILQGASKHAIYVSGHIRDIKLDIPPATDSRSLTLCNEVFL